MHLKPSGQNICGIIGFFCCCFVFAFFATPLPQVPADSGHCTELVEFLLEKYKEGLHEKNILQKQNYLEVKKLKKEMKDQSKASQKSFQNCSMHAQYLESDIKWRQHLLAETQKQLGEAFSTMDRTSVVLVTVLRALRQAEEKVATLEARLSQLTNGTW